MNAALLARILIVDDEAALDARLKSQQVPRAAPTVTRPAGLALALPVAQPGLGPARGVRAIG